MESRTQTAMLLAILVVAISLPAHAESASYTYDRFGRLTGVTYDNGTQIVYTYDAQGNRTQQTVTCGTGGC